MASVKSRTRKRGTVKGRLATFVVALSALISFVSVGLWINSYFYSASVDFNVRPGSHCEVRQWPGQLGVSIQEDNSYSGLPPHWTMVRQTGRGWSGYPTPFGLTILSLPGVPNPFLPKGWQFVMGYWLPAILGAVAPLVRLFLRFRRRPRPGRCSNCGYDLRASPARCPECGNLVAPSTTTSSALP
jgi:hypothetical protein